MTLLYQPKVAGFAGEDRLNRDDLLPPNVSPDALNVDYSSATIKKRRGYKRLHDVALKTGGVLINNSSDDGCLYAGSNAFAFTTTTVATFEISVQFLALPTADVDICGQHDVDDAFGRGWRIYYDQSRDRFTFYADMGLAAAAHEYVTFDTDLPSAGLDVGVTYHIAVVVDVDGLTIDVYVNDETESVTPAGGDWIGGPRIAGAGASYPFVAGAAFGNNGVPANQTCLMVLDEIRTWADRRTAAEISAFQGAELPVSISGAANGVPARESLAGYWKMNQGYGNSEPSACLISVGYPPMVFYGAGLTIQDGLVPKQGGDGFAFRGDGATTANGVAYTSQDVLPSSFYTTKEWTVELWCRLDYAGVITGQRLISIGAYDQGNGSVMELYTDASKNLTLLYSTTSASNNATVDTTYDIVAGTAFHVAVTRKDDEIKVYVNSVLELTQAVTDEAGPGSGSTNAGITLCARRHSTNGLENVGPFTVDEVRVWSVRRTAADIANWYQLTFPDTKHASLEAYYRFDAADFDGNEVGEKNSTTPNITLPSQATNPSWTFGLVGQQDVATQARVLLAAPLITPRGEEPTGEGGGGVVMQYTTPKTKEILAASNTSFYSIVEGELRWLQNFKRPTRTSFFDWCRFRGFLIVCNGAEENRKYDGRELPSTVTIATPTTTHVVTPTGSGSGWGGSAGDYSYVYAYRNTKDGTESLIGPIVTATMAATHDTAEITGLPSTCPSDDDQIDQIRIYRRDAGATTYRYLGDVDYGTTTYSDDGSSTAANDPLDSYRGHVPEARYCEVYKNRLWFLNANGASSALYYSEASTLQFPGANVIQVDRDDGDEGTGIIAAFGGLIVFKERSIHYLTGEGNTTFAVNKIVDNIGCVSGQTVVQAPGGVYFLGYDGVYVMGANTAPQYISHNQQTFFQRIDTTKKRLACAAYDPVRHQYIVSFDHLDYGRVTMSYDDETQTWARWNIGFDCLAVSEHTTNNETEVIGGRNGYVVRLFDGTQDGTHVDGDTERLYWNSTTVTVAAGDYAIDGGAERIVDSFPTTEDGLRGVPVMVVDSSGTVEHRTIITNTFQILYLDDALTVSGDITYLVGGIETYWESPWMDMGDPVTVKRWFELHTLLSEQADSTFTVKYKTEANETWQSATIACDDEFVRTLINTRGRRLKLRFQHDVPSSEGSAVTASDGEVESFLTVYSPKEITG